MKKMMDYSKFDLATLEAKAERHRKAIDRATAAGTPSGANRLVLAEIERHIEAKSHPAVIDREP